MKKFDLLVQDYPHFLHGADYNPDQWLATPEIWDTDMQLMREANCNEMTVGVFSWARLEPAEGVFCFDWLDTIMDKVYQNGGRVVLATPSAAPPRWLAAKYPEILAVAENGERAHFGMLQGFCPSSAVYREKVKSINEKLSQRYGNHPALAVWHLSNEYRDVPCYCDTCQQNFREWVRKKYDGDVEKLNTAWWRGVWSQAYQSFDQIEPPRLNGGEGQTHGLNLDWKRFLSDMLVDFAAKEAEAVRRYSNRPVTTNCMAYYAGFDAYKMGEVIDVAAQDCYPRWSRGHRFVAEEWSTICALYRGLKNGRPFMVMESAPGINVCCLDIPKVKTDKEQFLEAMYLVANGADTVSYFQWRKCRGGPEKFHGAVVDHYGKSDTRIFQNVRKTGAALQKIEGVLGCGIRAEAALVQDYDTLWALDGSPRTDFGVHASNGYAAMRHHFFRPALEHNIPMDVIPYTADFSSYKMLCLPVPYMMTLENADALKRFVAEGGVLVTTYMTAVVDETDLCYLGGQPGAALSELLGLRVDETDNYSPSTNFVFETHKEQMHTNFVEYGGARYAVQGIAERIVPSTAKTLAKFTENVQAGCPAVLCNAYGKGKAYYIGFEPSEAFMDDFMPRVMLESGLSSITDVTAESKDIRVFCREGEGERYLFVFNLSLEAQQISVNGAYTDLLTGSVLCGAHQMESLDVWVLKCV